MIFSFLSFAVAIPSAIKVFNWTATLYKGSISYDTPMLYALGFIGLFTIGGMTGLFLAALAVDVHLSDTYFVVAHFHYIMVGGTLLAYLGGLHYWWPKISGRMYPEGGGDSRPDSFCRFNLTFFAAVSAWLPGHAAALSHLSGGSGFVAGAACFVDSRRVDSGSGIIDSAVLSGLVDALRADSESQSVEPAGVGMADCFAAAD